MSILICAVMLMSLFCIYPSAYPSDFVPEGTFGGGFSYKYDPKKEELTVSGNGAIPDFTDDSPPWYPISGMINTTL